MFKQSFIENSSLYTKDQSVKDLIWKELNSAYSGSSRKYHNHNHLDNLYKELLPVRSTITDWNILLFSIACHGLVYNVLKNDNEEKSAEKAVSRLKQLNIAPDKLKVAAYRYRQLKVILQMIVWIPIISRMQIYPYQDMNPGSTGNIPAR